MYDSPKHAGEIVRIHLENFMSYDNIDIYPGYHLNLIIGPNGTGKSTIVCAVLLGLGGKLKTLGRADHLGSYVKSGCRECCIEIELYEPEGHNVIIERKIREDNHSEFIVNGKCASAAKVNEIRKKYNIQIDNLCTFLPQEKVQDFAKLNSQELLDQTQRTVGNGELVQLHEELKKLRLKIFEQEKHNDLLKDEIENEKQKNERLEDKIKTYREKQSLCNKLTILNQKKAWLQYMKEVESKEVIENDTKLAERAYKEKKEEVEEFNQTLLQMQKTLNFHQQKLNDAKKDEAGKKSAMENILEKAERRVDQLEDLKSELKAKMEEEKNKKAELNKCKENVEKLKNDLNNLDSSIGSGEELEKQQEEINYQFRSIQKEEVSLNQIKVDLEEDEDTLKQELRNTVAECQNLKKRRDIRLEYLKRREPDVVKSMEWLEKNRHLFQSHIYNPMLLELDVPNTKMAKFVEARLGYKDLISFTCTNPDDLNLLIQKLRTEQKLKINAICSDEFDDSQYTPKIPIKNLRCYGFYSYLNDLITGPPDIIRFLCKTYRIHCIPVGDERVKVNCGKVPQNIPIFYSENHVFSVKYSVYSGDKSITVKKLNEPKFFAESFDEKRVQILMERKNELEAKIQKKQKEIVDLDSQLKKLRTSMDEVIKKKRQLATSVEERKQIQMNLNRALNNYNSIKETLKNPKELELEILKKKECLNKEIRRNFEDLKLANDEAEKMIFTRQKLQLQFTIARLKNEKYAENKALVMEKLTQKEKFFRDMKDRLKTSETRCLKLKEEAMRLTENIAMGDKNFNRFQKEFKKLPNSLDDVEMEIEETKAKADFLQDGNLEILQDYEERERRINQLTANWETSVKTLENKKSELTSKREAWINPVTDLVSNINVNFGKFFQVMGCAGEVSLITGDNKDDFDQYGIKILVKFRDESPLQELSRYLQSGGERAVATAIFMLSLQELTSVPFRFVDEINQGMDPTNERKILQLIIQVTAPEHSTQYFFITPKLLPDVECSETMTVLCIYNGPNAIPACEWNPKKFLKTGKKLYRND